VDNWISTSISNCLLVWVTDRLTDRRETTQRPNIIWWRLSSQNAELVNWNIKWLVHVKFLLPKDNLHTSITVKKRMCMDLFMYFEILFNIAFSDLLLVHCHVISVWPWTVFGLMTGFVELTDTAWLHFTIHYYPPPPHTHTRTLMSTVTSSLVVVW
jgi:hypothetical protein